MKRLFLFVIVLVFVLTASSCSSEKPDVHITHLTDYKTQDILAKDFYENINVDITPPKEDSDITTVEISIPDLAAIYRENRDSIRTAKTTEEIQKVLHAHLYEHTLTTTITENIIQDGQTWRLSKSQQVDNLIASVVDEYLSAVASDAETIEIAVDFDEDVIMKSIKEMEEGLSG